MMKRMALGVAFAASLLISAQPAAAQTAAQPAPAQSAEPAPSAHKLELARQVVEASGMDDTLTNGLRAAAAQMTASAAKSLSPDRQAKMKIIGEAEGDALAKMGPQIIDNVVDGYARDFTEQELTDFLAFYRSPSGRAMVTKLPQFMHGLLSEMSALMPQVRRDMGEEICAKTTCTAAERAAYFGPEPAKSEPQAPPPPTAPSP